MASKLSYAARKRHSQSRDAPAIRINYRPQGPVMEQFHRRDEFVRIVVGPLGSSKTFGAINEVLRQCHEQTPNRERVRKSRWVIARNSFPDLNATTIPDVREVVDKINPDGWNMQMPVTWKHSYPRADGTTVQVELMFRSFDGEQDVKKARGLQVTGVWVDELAEFNKSNFDMLIGRVKRYPAKAEVPDAKFSVLGTSNACPRDHWLAEFALAEQQPYNWWIGIQAPGVFKVGNKWVENPRSENFKNLARHYYLDQCAGKAESWIRQNLANEFVHHTDGRPIHPDFSEQLHVVPCEPVPGQPIYIGIDYGRTPAATIMQRDPVINQWQVLRELVTVNMGAERFGQLLKVFLNEHFQGYTIAAMTGDPAGSDMAQTRDETPADLMAMSGFDVLPASTNDPEIRYAALDERLRDLTHGQPAIIIDPSCTVLIRGLAGKYQFRRIQVVGESRYKDQPDKGPTSHVCEALHYNLLGAGEGDVLYEQGWSEEYDAIDDWAPNQGQYE